MKIWTGKLVLRDGRKAGLKVEARIVLGGSGQTMLEVRDGSDWVEARPDEIHPTSWLRALGETGQEVP